MAISEEKNADYPNNISFNMENNGADKDVVIIDQIIGETQIFLEFACLKHHSKVGKIWEKPGAAETYLMGATIVDPRT